MKNNRYTTLLALVALNVVSCQQSDPEKKQGNRAVEITAEAKSALSLQMKTPLKYLDIDGEYLKLNNLTSEVNFTKNLLDDAEVFIRRIAKEEDVKLPQNVSLKEILEKLQLDELTGLSASSKQVESGWVNKFFISNNETNSGVYAIYKEKEEAWGVLDFAPESADLVFEQSQNLEAVLELLKYASSVAGDDYVKLLHKGLAHKPKSSERTIEEELEGLTLRTAIVVDFDKSHQIKNFDGKELFNFDCAIRIDGGARAWKFFSEEIEADSEIEEKGGLRFVKSPNSYEIYKGLPKIRPMFIVDKEKDQLWFVLRESYFDLCKNEAGKLKDSAGFKKVLEPLDKTGFSFSYTSGETLEMIRDFYSKDVLMKGHRSIESGYVSEREMAIAEPIFGMLEKTLIPQFSRSKEGYATTWKLQPEGLLMSNYDAFPSKGLPVASHDFSMYPLLGMYLAPNLDKKMAESRAVSVLNNSKDIYVGMRDHAFHNSGVLPGSLEMKSSNEAFRIFFATRAIIDEKPFYVKGFSGFEQGDENVVGKEALKAGENIYAYCYGANLISGKSKRPVVMAPLKKENGKIIPDAEVLAGQLVVLSLDGAAFVVNLDVDGNLPENYRYLLDPTDEVWQDKDGNSPSELPILLPEPKQ